MAQARRVSGVRGRKHDALDWTIAELARRQHGLVARRQLVARGIGADAVRHRVDTGRLHRVHRGVYAVGHDLLTADGRALAALLAYGERATLTHHSAGAAWAVRASARAAIDVTLPYAAAARAGIELHRSRLPADEVTVLRGLRIATVARTLIDLAAVLDGAALERALAEAEVRRLADRVALPELLARYPRRAGTRALRELVAARRADAGVTRSALEERFVALVDAAGLPRPELNAALDAGGRWVEADCAWRAERVAVELDGHAFHATRAAFERDRERDRALQAAGWRVVRVTWRQLDARAAAVLADLARLLSRSPPPC